MNKPDDYILIKELEKKVMQRDEILKDLEKVVHLHKLHCIEALLDHVTKIQNQIQMLRLILD